MGTVSIPLTKGKVALIDADDLPLVEGYPWRAKKPSHCRIWYAVARPSYRADSGKMVKRDILMHRLIMGAASGMMIDHVDRDDLNNTRVNLRLATNSQNQANSGPQSRNSSGYKGVYWHEQKHKWAAQIRYDGRAHYLGRYETAEGAAVAYDKKAREVFGEFAHLNFPDA